MSAPLLAILFPAGASVLLFGIRRWNRLTSLLGASLAAAFAWLTWRIPVDVPVVIGTWSFKLAPVFSVYGRRFILEDVDRPLLILLHLFTALWIAVAYLASADDLFVPLGFAVVALLTAMIAVEPFLYAALFIEMMALVSIPILVPPGTRVTSGVLRFLTFQTLGAPFILFTGWMLTGVEASPGELELVVRAGVLLGFGFAFLLAIVPFHTWIPMLFEETHPYVVAFLIFMTQVGIMVFGLGFLDRYAWLRSSENLQTLLRVAGTLMVLVGGLWAAFQTNLGRILGFAIILDIGMALLSLSIPNPAALELFFGRVISLGIALVVWSMALTAIASEYPDLEFRTVQGFGRRKPLIAAAVFVAHFSLAGFPLLLGFPVRLGIWRELASPYPLVAMASIVGTVGLLAGGLRSLAVLMMAREPAEEPLLATLGLRVFFAFGLAALVLLGVFPRLTEALLSSLVQVYANLALR